MRVRNPSRPPGFSGHSDLSGYSGLSCRPSISVNINDYIFLMVLGVSRGFYRVSLVPVLLLEALNAREVL